MKKKLSVLVLTSILIFLFSASTLDARNELGLFFTRGKPSYSQMTKTFYGGEFQFFYGSKSFCFDISEWLGPKQNPSGIGNFDTNLFRARIEASIWRFFAVNLSCSLWKEAEEVCPFSQPRIIIADKWYKNEITAGLGVKIGRYDKSYLSLTGIFGSSYRRHAEDLTFLDMKLSHHSSSRIIGASTKGRLEFSRLMIDFQGNYNYYPQDKKYRVELMTSLGVKIIKHLGIKGGAAIAKIAEKRGFSANKVYGGLVWVF